MYYMGVYYSLTDSLARANYCLKEASLLPNYGDPISSPMGEPITMIFDMPISQKGSPRTTHPAVSAAYPNQTVAVHVTHYK